MNVSSNPGKNSANNLCAIDFRSGGKYYKTCLPSLAHCQTRQRNRQIAGWSSTCGAKHRSIDQNCLVPRSHHFCSSRWMPHHSTGLLCEAGKGHKEGIALGVNLAPTFSLEASFRSCSQAPVSIQNKLIQAVCAPFFLLAAVTIFAVQSGYIRLHRGGSELAVRLKSKSPVTSANTAQFNNHWAANHNHGSRLISIWPNDSRSCCWRQSAVELWDWR